MLLAGLLFMSCNLSDSEEGDDFNFSILVTNATSKNITLFAGDYNNLEAEPLGKSSKDIDTLEVNVQFNLNASTDYNLWYVDRDTQSVTRFVLNDELRVFNFDSNISYVLVIEDHRFNLYEFGLGEAPDDTLPDPTPDVDVHTYKVLTASRNSASTLEDSVNAQNLIPLNATIEKVAKRYGGYYVHFYATFQYNGTETESDPLSFPKARYTLLDSSGNELYSSLYGGGDGFKYLDSSYVARYQASDGTYNYGNYYVFKGDKIYLNRYEYISSDETGHPLYDIDLSLVSEIKFDLIGTTYSSLGIEKIPTGENLTHVNTMDSVNNRVDSVVTNNSSTQWLQVRSYDREYYLLDSNQNIVTVIDSNLATNSLDLIEPLATASYYGEIPEFYSTVITDVVFAFDYEPGVPVRSVVETLTAAEKEEIADYYNSILGK